MNRKRKNTIKIVEVAILFALFYLPSYIFQSAVINNKAFNDPIFNIQLWFIYIPQIALIIYLLFINPEKDLIPYGIVKLNFRILPYIAITSILLVIIVGLIQLLFILFPFPMNGEDLFIWKFSNLSITPLLLITCFLTGYSEELFFRSYLFIKLKKLGFSSIHGLITVNTLFSIGHFYEGIMGGVTALILGSFFSLIFLWKKNLHLIAIVHGIYNFTVLILSAYV